jgi:3'-5' exonuclease
MKPSVIVWDLETVPDLGGFAAANDLVGKSDVEVREAIGEKFPKHIYHPIVCIGALIAHREPDHWAVDAVGAPRARANEPDPWLQTTGDISQCEDRA